MLQFISLSSGSCGNCYFLTDGEGGLLIDAGVSLRRLKRVLGERGFSLDAFQSILVTHDHLDHIRHLGAYCKHLGRPVYSTERILEALSRHSFTMDWIGPYRRTLPEGGACRLSLSPSGSGDGPLVRWFTVPHDATHTVGYDIRWGGVHFVLMTDVGRMTEEALAFAREADAVVVESNYDTDMLLYGTYPPELKERIRNGSGHMSNDECAAAVRAFWHPGLRDLFLCHLSENNNTPRLAYEATAAVLRSIPLPDGRTAADVTHLETLSRRLPSRVFILQDL